MTNNEYEVISHSNSNYNVFLIEIMYRTPHMHKDFEICLVLEGAINAKMSEQSFTVRKNDLWIVNPFETHEYEAIGSRALVLILQVNAAFFAPFYKSLSDIQFSSAIISAEDPKYKDIFKSFFAITKNSYFPVDRSELKCAQQIISLFDNFMDLIPYQYVDESDQKSHKKNSDLIRKITHYVDENYYRKLLLSDIATETNLSVNYLSHCFKNAIGMSFQQYLAKIRCDRARILLVTTHLSLFDISISCGFSDVKYFKKNFEEFYGTTPQDFRTKNTNLVEKENAANSITTQKRLSSEASRKILSYYLDKTV